MKLSEIVFKKEDCCGQHEAATVTLADGRTVGILRSEDVYTLNFYGSEGLIDREICVSAERVAEVIG